MSSRMTSRALAQLALIGVLALAVTVALASAFTEIAAAKKKKAGGRVNITRTVNAPIPDAQGSAPSTTWGRLTSTINVGKRFKGARVRDVNVTFQTTGGGINSAGDLLLTLTSPNGSSTMLFGFPGGGRSVGPLTIDDESVNALQATDATPPSDPPRDSTRLADPWIGTAQPYCFQAVGGCPLALLDNGPAKGTWTLTAWDSDTVAGQTSSLNFWRLNVVTGKPFVTG
jgi:subtilisin-like proprotein convertase family protein